MGRNIWIEETDFFFKLIKEKNQTATLVLFRNVRNMAFLLRKTYRNAATVLTCIWCHSHANRPPATRLVDPHRKLWHGANLTNDVYISYASTKQQWQDWAAYPQCFVFAGGMELHSHPLRNSGSIHIRVESAGARGPWHLHQTRGITIRDST